MNATLERNFIQSRLPEDDRYQATPFPSEPFVSVVVIYADDTASELGSSIFANIMRELKEGLASHVSYWSFEHLHHSEMRLLAAESAREAEIVFVATHEGHELPGVVRSWIECWAKEKKNSTRALGLLTVENQQKTPALDTFEADLQSVAGAARIDFFSQTFHCVSAIPFPAQEFSNEGQELRRWGLNE